jgi:hypothetical protein
MFHRRRERSRVHTAVLVHTSAKRKIQCPSRRPPSSVLHPAVLHTSPRGRSRFHTSVLHTSPWRKIQVSYLSPPYFTLEEDPGSWDTWDTWCMVSRTPGRGVVDTYVLYCGLPSSCLYQCCSSLIWLSTFVMLAVLLAFYIACR